MNTRASIIRALKFVPFASIEDHFRCGWVILIPREPMHHHYYGVEMAFMCDCKIPVVSR